MIDLKLFKIKISSQKSRFEIYRYGITSNEVIKHIREEFARYDDKRSEYKMDAEELSEIVGIKIKR